MVTLTDDSEQRRYDKYDELIGRHWRLIEGLCMHHAFGDRAQCDELRQRCYLALWHYLPTLREGAKPWQETAWVVWHCRSVFSHIGSGRQEPTMVPLDEAMADTIGGEEENTARERLDEAAGLLTDYERRAFYLMADGYDAEELAKELGIKHRSAVLLRHRIVRKLRKHYGTLPQKNDNKQNK